VSKARDSFPQSLRDCPAIVFRRWDFTAAIANTPLASAKVTEPVHPTAQANWLRAIVLYKYGGVYFDLDTVFLRDLWPLLDKQFYYRAGSLPQTASASVMRLFAAPSHEAVVLLRDAMAGGYTGAALSDAASANSLTSLHMYSPYLFDPAWLYVIRADEQPVFNVPNSYMSFFKNVRNELDYPKNPSVFFTGAFMFHWHADDAVWHLQPQKKSFFTAFSEAADRWISSHCKSMS